MTPPGSPGPAGSARDAEPGRRWCPSRGGVSVALSEVPMPAAGTLCHPRGAWAALSTARKREGACLGKHAPKRGAL